jgi:hypothetical protein
MLVEDTLDLAIYEIAIIAQLVKLPIGSLTTIDLSLVNVSIAEVGIVTGIDAIDLDV